MAVILTGNLRFRTTNYHFGPFYTILDHFRSFWMGTLSKMTGNFKILAKVLYLLNTNLVLLLKSPFSSNFTSSFNSQLSLQLRQLFQLLKPPICPSNNSSNSWLSCQQLFVQITPSCQSSYSWQLPFVPLTPTTLSTSLTPSWPSKNSSNSWLSCQQLFVQITPSCQSSYSWQLPFVPLTPTTLSTPSWPSKNSSNSWLSYQQHFFVPITPNCPSSYSWQPPIIPQTTPPTDKFPPPPKKGKKQQQYSSHYDLFSLSLSPFSGQYGMNYSPERCLSKRWQQKPLFGG